MAPQSPLQSFQTSPPPPTHLLHIETNPSAYQLHWNQPTKSSSPVSINHSEGPLTTSTWPNAFIVVWEERRYITRWMEGSIARSVTWGRTGMCLRRVAFWRTYIEGYAEQVVDWLIEWVFSPIKYFLSVLFFFVDSVIDSCIALSI